MKLPFSGAQDAVLTTQHLMPASYGVLAHVSIEPLEAPARTDWLIAFDQKGQELSRVRMDPSVKVSPRVAEALMQDVNPGTNTNWPAAPESEAATLAVETVDGPCRLRVDATGCHVEGWGTDRVTLTTPGDHHRAILTKAAISGNFLYVGKADACAGFLVIRYDLTDPTAAGKEVLTRGAGRFSLNAAVSSMVPTQGGILIGTAALAGYDGQVGNWNSELILLLESGEWDLIIGQPRFSLDGLKLPASGQTPGFGNPANAAISAILPGPKTILILQEFAGANEPERRNVTIDLLGYQGKCSAWISDDLTTWTEVPLALPAEHGAITSAVLAGETLWLGFETLDAHTLPLAAVAVSA